MSRMTTRTGHVRTTGLWLLMLLALFTGDTVHAADDDDPETDWRSLQQSSRINEWVPVREDKRRHIRLFSKVEEGRRLRSMKVEAELDAPMARVISTLTDFPGFTGWLWNLKEIRVLRQGTSGEHYLHLLFRTPGGLPDRDVVLRYQVRKNDNGRQTLIQAEDAPDFPSLKPGVVRIPDMSLTIVVEASERGGTRFSSQLQLDPGGQVPVWAANFVQRRAPYATMLGLIRALGSS